MYWGTCLTLRLLEGACFGLRCLELETQWPLGWQTMLTSPLTHSAFRPVVSSPSARSFKSWMSYIQVGGKVVWEGLPVRTPMSLIQSADEAMPREGLSAEQRNASRSDGFGSGREQITVSSLVCCRQPNVMYVYFVLSQKSFILACQRYNCLLWAEDWS